MPGFLELVIGRITVLEWAQDRVRSLKDAEPEHEQGRELLGDPWEELGIDLTTIKMDLVDFRTADKSERGARKGSRPYSQIDGDCFHQTGGPVDDVERCTRIPAHTLITPTAVGIAHPPTAYLYHGHYANRRFNGNEISCRAAGIEGNSKAFWRSKKEKNGYKDKKGRRHPPKHYAELVREPFDRQLMAAFFVARYHARLNAIAGHPHTKYCYHRNTHKSRISDPGSKSALYLSPRLESELEQRPILKLGSGSLTPQVWGGRDGIKYSGRVSGL